MSARQWAMPNKHTFKIAPIAALLDRYLTMQGAGWIDPFCGHSLRAQYRNDADPKNAFATHHMDAREFLEEMSTKSFSGCLFDPPYSPRQISEHYKRLGKSATTSDTQNAKLYKECRDLIAPIICKFGLVISFGWNSTGMGKTRGFELIEMLNVNHGGAHNDTICIVERKIT